MQDELTVLFDRLALREPEEAEAQARSILSGLGFTKDQQDAPLGQLSGTVVGPAVRYCGGAVEGPAVRYILAFGWPHLWGAHGSMVRWRYAVRLD